MPVKNLTLIWILALVGNASSASQNSVLQILVDGPKEGGDEAPLNYDIGAGIASYEGGSVILGLKLGTDPSSLSKKVLIDSKIAFSTHTGQISYLDLNFKPFSDAEFMKKIAPSSLRDNMEFGFLPISMKSNKDMGLEFQLESHLVDAHYSEETNGFFVDAAAQFFGLVLSVLTPEAKTALGENELNEIPNGGVSWFSIQTEAGLKASIDQNVKLRFMVGADAELMDSPGFVQPLNSDRDWDSKAASIYLKASMVARDFAFSVSGGRMLFQRNGKTGTFYSSHHSESEPFIEVGFNYNLKTSVRHKK